MVTAFSISAEDLLRQSPDLYALLLFQRLPRLKFRRRINEYILHDEYYKSVTGEDGEELLDALGSPPYTDMVSYPYSDPPTNRHSVSTQATERASIASAAACH